MTRLSPFLAATVANLVAMLPAEAATGKIFDFNLTFAFMVGEFLLLMVFLEKTWFTPVGAVLDERDKYIRDKLATVGVCPPCGPRCHCSVTCKATPARLCCRLIMLDVFCFSALGPCCCTLK